MHILFGLQINEDSLVGMTIPLVIAVILGGLIGGEREIHGHPAGMRTHILVCVGSTLITLVSTSIGQQHGAHGDPARLAAQIVSGVGFLGAGAILREGMSVRGLTTAASIWATAGVGIALGANPFYGKLAIIATIIVLITLWAMTYVENWIDLKARRAAHVCVTLTDSGTAVGEVLSVLLGHEIEFDSVRIEPGSKAGSRNVHLHVHFPPSFRGPALAAELSARHDVLGIDVD